jgi:hypothetical protein
MTIRNKGSITATEKGDNNFSPWTGSCVRMWKHIHILFNDSIRLSLKGIAPDNLGVVIEFIIV